MSGKTIVPGLVNAHGHLQADASKRPARDRLTAQLRMYADYGITTVQVLGLPLDDVPDGIKLRDESRPGGAAVDRARVLIAAASLRNLKTEQEARDWANKYADMKVDIIKMHITGGPMDMTPAVYGALIDQAHKRGLRTAAHLFYLRDAKGLLDKGIDVIAHSIRDQPVDPGDHRRHQGAQRRLHPDADARHRDVRVRGHTAVLQRSVLHAPHPGVVLPR